MRTLTTLLSIMALTFALGCSGGDSGDGGGPAADANGSSADADPTGGADAMPSGVADGQACTASEADPTGGCPTGYVCLSAGAGGGACFNECTGAGSVCPGYEGPGASLCIVQITDAQMNPIGNACGIVCGDTNGQVAGCAGGACDGTCPGTWSCVNSNQDGVKICQ